MATTPFMLILISGFLLANASIPSSDTCPPQCRCDKRKNVYCQNKKLTYVPRGIPEDTETLHLQDNSISNSQEMENILTGLKKLRRLNLSNNTLTAFPRNLPSSLTTININFNTIRYIATDVFVGLSSLQTLFLDNNSLTEKGMLATSFQGASNLIQLTLTSNLLTKVPSGIPPSVRMLRLNKNKINTVLRESLRDLVSLRDLDLRDNELTMESFQPGVFNNLVSLETLDLGYNKLQNIPIQLPTSIRNLLMPNNLIEYVFAEENNEHGSLQKLSQLQKLDLSKNQLRSVEDGAFSGLESLSAVILHHNPWQCDCYLKYLKSWLSSSGLVVNHESSMKCATPAEITDVTLDSLDMQSMLCFDDQKPNTAISSSSPTNLVMSWSIRDGSYPPYAKYRVMFGEMKCGNCSDYPLEDETWKTNNRASSLVVSYQIIPVVEPTTNGDFVSVELPSINSDTSYMACLLNSFEDPQMLKAEPCKFVRKSVATTPPIEAPGELGENTVPIWIMVIIMSAVITLLAIVIALIIKKRLFMKSKLKRTQTSTAGYYDPFAHTYLRPEPFISHTQTTPVGSSNIPQYRDNDRLMSYTSDATKEFDVTLMVRPDPNNPNLLRPPHGGGSPETCIESCCSDFQNATLSTNNTHATSNSIGSEVAEVDGNSLSRDDCSFPYLTQSTRNRNDDEYIYHTIASNTQSSVEEDV